MKYIFFTCLVILSLNAVSAQNRGDEFKKFKLGLLVTPQLSWLSSDDPSVSSDGVVAGISYGLLADFFFAKNYAISVGVLRSHTGGKLKFANESSFNINDSYKTFPPNSGMKYTLNYFEIPVGLKLKTKLFRRIGYYGQLGLTPMINTKAVSGDGDKLIDEVQIGDIGYHFGGGIEYSLGGETYLHAAIFYTSGLIDITTNDNLSDYTKLNTINLRLGINF